MAKSKLGRNPFQLKTTPVQENPLFAEKAAEPAIPRAERRRPQAAPKATAAAETIATVPPLGGADTDEGALSPGAVIGLAGFGLLKGYALIRGLVVR